MSNTIISPIMLWNDFDAYLPLMESKTKETTINDIVYNDVYFSGRCIGEDRVRIFGVYAHSKDTNTIANKGGILIIPDMDKTVDISIIDIYARQGYSVLMIDYRGECEGVDNFTKYPKDIEYSNYFLNNNIDSVQDTVKETCWYEWASVCKYAISFLSMREEVDKIGVIGIGNGSNLGWILCGTDLRVDCFLPLYGAGWRAYKGINKFEDGADLKPNDEKLKFLAGIDAHAYAQYVKCPVFFMTATNNPDFDIDRSVDTLFRLPKSTEYYVNYAPRFISNLGKYCKLNGDLFLAKELLNYQLDIPNIPQLDIDADGDKITLNVDIDCSNNKTYSNVTVYVAEGGLHAEIRDWCEATIVKDKNKDKKEYVYQIQTNARFINAFVIVQYDNGITLSSLMNFCKIENEKNIANKLIYSSSFGQSSFMPYIDNGQKDLFYQGELPILKVGGDNICGVTCNSGLMTLKLNSRFANISEDSIIKFDVFCQNQSQAKVSLLLQEDDDIYKYSMDIDIVKSDYWQNFKLNILDFKKDNILSIKNVDSIVGIIFEGHDLLINNLLVI